jgi:peptidoglycan/xylan/chitin deacetylase (PgdA/CDA1 family)
MERLSKEDCIRQIKEAHKLVKDMLGVDMNLFRAPYGEFSKNILEASRQSGYYPIKWNVDSKDWKDYGTAAIVNEICNNQELKEGSIVLCHTSTKFIKNALNKVVLVLQKRGYSFERISDMIYKYDYHLNKDGRQIQNS